jgi:hypothetical protein
MIGAHLPGLFTGLFDDASMFPPQDEPVQSAVVGHLTHRAAWYADLIGPFVCSAGRITTVDALVARRGIERVDVSMVVTDGFDDLSRALEWAGSCAHLRVAAIEIPLGLHDLRDAVRRLEPLLGDGRLVYLEIPVLRVNEHHVHDLAPTGVRLKLRTGGTSIEAFQTEDALAKPIVLCAAERLAFKCTAGLHHAVRQRDAATLFEHHGFLNVALAARAAAATGSHAATSALLAERDPHALAYQISDLTPADVLATRALFSSFGTCSISEPIDDLLGMGLVSVP